MKEDTYMSREGRKNSQRRRTERRQRALERFKNQLQFYNTNGLLDDHHKDKIAKSEKEIAILEAKLAISYAY